MSKPFRGRTRWRSGMGRTARRISSIAEETIKRNSELKYADAAGFITISPSSATPFINLAPRLYQGASNENDLIGTQVRLKGITVKFNYWVEVNVAASSDAYIPTLYVTGHIRIILCRAKFAESFTTYTFEQLFDNLSNNPKGRILAFPKPELIEVLKDEVQLITTVNSNIDPAFGVDKTVRHDHNPLGCAPVGGCCRWYKNINLPFRFNSTGTDTADPNGKYFLAVVFSPLIGTNDFTSYETKVLTSVRYSYYDL